MHVQHPLLSHRKPHCSLRRCMSARPCHQVAGLQHDCAGQHCWLAGKPLGQH